MDTQKILHEVESEISKLERVAEILRALAAKSTEPRGPRKSMSAAARKKISLAQKARWAKRSSTGQTVSTKPKRTMSASARRKIAAAQRIRWAKVRAQEKKAA